MAGGRKRERSTGAIYGMGDVSNPLDPYGASAWMGEPTAPRPATIPLLRGIGKSPDLDERIAIVRAIWELVADHGLTDQRFRTFARRTEVRELGELSDVRLVIGARTASSEHPRGHVLLSQWLTCAKRLTPVELDARKQEALATLGQLRHQRP